MVSKCDWQCPFMLTEHWNTERPFLGKRCDRRWVQSVVQLRTNIYMALSLTENGSMLYGILLYYREMKCEYRYVLMRFVWGYFGVFLCVWLFSWIVAWIVAFMC